MKEDYTIHEIAGLYGVGPDALRYYERLGLIRPRRGENGYRLYSLGDVQRLTVIRDLRELGFDTGRIGAYLNQMSVANTLSTLEEEETLIRRRMTELARRARAIRARAGALKAFAAVSAGQIELAELPRRPCVRLRANISRDEEVDFAVKKLHSQHAGRIREIGNLTVGAAMSPEDIAAGVYGQYRSVFILLETDAEEFDFALPAGTYARVFYRGSYRQCPAQLQTLLEWAARRGQPARDDALELYHIDNRYTAREEEFLTELQLRLEE